MTHSQPPMKIMAPASRFRNRHERHERATDE
jgi:hypothetical protein